MKRFSALFLALAMALCIFSACEKKETASNSEKTEGTAESTIEGTGGHNPNNEDEGSEGTGKYYPTKMTKYDADGKASAEFTYNYEFEGGKPVKASLVNSAGTELAYTEIEYDDEGNVIKESDYDGGEIYWAREYDQWGKIVKEYNYQEGKVYSYYENEYHAYGHLVKTVSYDENGTAYRDLEYEHDEYGNVTREVTYLYSGGSKTEYDRTEYEYELGDYGKPLKKMDETTVYEYEYDADYNMIKCSAYYEGELWEVTEYDTNGNVIKESTYDAGALSYSYAYEYTTY